LSADPLWQEQYQILSDQWRSRRNIAERSEELERKSANVQLEITALGLVSPQAKAFLESLPKVEELVKPLDAAEVFALMESRPARG
jgi:hypothetical protein